jgi:hypothetical protein
LDRYRETACDVDVLFRGKELTLKISFKYVDDRHSSLTAGRKAEKRGKSPVTKRMLSERDAQLDADENASGEKPICVASTI